MDHFSFSFHKKEKKKKKKEDRVGEWGANDKKKKVLLGGLDKKTCFIMRQLCFEPSWTKKLSFGSYKFTI